MSYTVPLTTLSLSSLVFLYTNTLEVSPRFSDRRCFYSHDFSNTFLRSTYFFRMKLD
jgi:hypothetical protein